MVNNLNIQFFLLCIFITRFIWSIGDCAGSDSHSHSFLWPMMVFFIANEFAANAWVNLFLTQCGRTKKQPSSNQIRSELILLKCSNPINMEKKQLSWFRSSLAFLGKMLTEKHQTHTNSYVLFRNQIDGNVNECTEYRKIHVRGFPHRIS